MCVLDLWMLWIYVERCFKSYICWFDLCLSSLLVAFIFMSFFLLWKTHFLQARQLLDKSSTYSLLSSLSFSLSRKILTESRSIEISRFLLDKFSTTSSIHWATFCLADRFSTDSWSVEVFLPLTNPRQHLDRFISVEI